MPRLIVLSVVTMLCAAIVVASAAEKSSGARIAIDDDASSEASGFRTVPLKRLESCLGQYVRLNFPGNKVREGILVSASHGWVVLEQRIGSSTSTVRLVEKHIDTVELKTDTSQPLRHAGTLSFVSQSSTPVSSGELPSSNNVDNGTEPDAGLGDWMRSPTSVIWRAIDGQSCPLPRR